MLCDLMLEEWLDNTSKKPIGCPSLDRYLEMSEAGASKEELEALRPPPEDIRIAEKFIKQFHKSPLLSRDGGGIPYDKIGKFQ